jgi:hypothetical protein
MHLLLSERDSSKKSVMGKLPAVNAVSKIFGCESVDDDWDGFNANSVIQVG